MAEDLEQGETYEEEESRDQEESKTHSGFKNNVMVIAIVLVIIVAVAVIGIYYLKFKGSDNTGEGGYYDEEEDYGGDFEFDTEFVEGEITTAPEYTVFTEEETTDLRKWGYTGDEIEFYQNQAVSYDSLIEAAQSLRERAAEESIKKLSDKGSKEYKTLMQMTWLVGKKFKVKKVNEEDPDLIWTYDTIVENVDYIKCDPRGKQLFLRCKLDDGTYVFMDVLPERWVRLKNKGNIVIQYTLENYGGTKVISDIVEIEQGVD